MNEKLRSRCVGSAWPSKSWVATWCSMNPMPIQQEAMRSAVWVCEIKGNAVPIATNDVPMTRGRTMPTRSTQRPARTENNIGSTANTATSVPTLKVDRPICSAVSETVIRPPVRAT
ncbi:hypothetical protein G6F22_020979 [Rhizopus arrhizus]|nr:hypothetical protein G6F22_020979 [Rhizopus arrhizus]